MICKMMFFVWIPVPLGCFSSLITTKIKQNINQPKPNRVFYFLQKHGVEFLSFYLYISFFSVIYRADNLNPNPSW